MHKATTQVTTNTPTMTKPVVLMLKPARKDQNDPSRWAFWASRPSSSIAPTNTATNTDRPVMVRL